ncbi:MAG: membrane protein insertase YidC [Planctomycetes bacterium]|nr:membrane protein insertase YidC [Planctomycetota bacterium]
MRPLLTFLLWAIIAWLLFRSCTPEEQNLAEVNVDFHAEDFTDYSAEEKTFVLENELLWTKWSSVGASCLEVRLKEYTPFLMHDKKISEDDWLYLFRAQSAQPPAAGHEPSMLNYTKRMGLRLFEAGSELGTNLDSSPWTAELRPESNQIIFRIETANGVEMVKSVQLAPNSYSFDLEVQAEAKTLQLAGKDLSMRVGTGGGVVKEADRFYPNPYVAAGVKEHGVLEDFESHFPSGSLPDNNRRDMVARWKGDIAYVVEGSKYFLSAIQPVNASFRGAVAEVLYDESAREDAILTGLTEEVRREYKDVGRYEQILASELGSYPTSSQVADRAGMDLGRVQAIQGDLQNRVRAVSLGQGAWYLSEYWQRASVAGDFSMHISRPEDPASRASFQWYVGPKDNALLAPFGDMASIPEFADYSSSFFYRMFFTHWIAPGIMWLLTMFHTLVGNWGVAIILLTILVRGALMPLNRRSQLKMAEYQVKMQKVKPMMDNITKKFAKDPKRKQQEMTKLYKKHQVAPPLGGCLPPFLQMPIFIGLFAALRSSLKLRQQPFFGWMEDLSRPDALIDFGGPVADFFPMSGVTSFNLLPIIMVVLWVAHQKTMPKPADPNQAQMQKIMTFMPILFGVMLYNYAAGLSLYMITSSAIGIFEAKVIKKKWPVTKPTDAMTG